MRQRLDRTVAGQANLTRSEAKALIRRGAVQVNGKVVRDGGCGVDWDRDTVEVEGTPLRLTQHLYLMLNKPKGVVSATQDQRFATVLDLVPQPLRRRGLFPAGRLDKDTTGFVLITDDGEFAHRILSPKRHVVKTYLAQVDGPIGPEVVEGFARGVDIRGEYTTLPARLEVAQRLPGGDVGRVMICEGMYHQIKRMFQAFGLRVVELRRVKMGALELDPRLAEGECRELTPQELELVGRREERWFGEE